MRLLWIFTFLLLPAAVYARGMPGAVPVKAVPAEICVDLFAALNERKVRLPEPILKPEEAPSLEIAEAAEAIEPEILELEKKLPTDSDNLHRQAKELVELRAYSAERGSLADEQMAKRHQALEVRNNKIGLIPNDPDGRSFVETAKVFPSYTSTEKFDWLKHYASSRHPDSRSTLLKLLNAETDPEVRRTLREVAVARGFPIPYKKLMGDLKAQIEKIAATGNNNQKLLVSELRDIPAENLDLLLKSENTPFSKKYATQGLVGREIEYLKKYANHPDRSMRLGAVMALENRFSDESFAILKNALQDRAPEVRNAAVHALGRYENAAATKVMRSVLRTGDDSMKAAAREHWRHPGWGTDAVIWTNKIPGFPSDDQLLFSFLEEPAYVAKNSTSYLATRSTTLIKKALQAANPENRLAALRALADRTSPADRRVVGKMLLDPVADIRKEAATILADANNQSREIRMLLEKASAKDPDLGVRRAIKERLLAYSEENIPLRMTEDMQAKQITESLSFHYDNPNLRSDDIYGLAGAEHVYQAPEFQTAKTAEEMVEHHRSFLSSAPLGYEVKDLISDPRSGLKAALYRPITGSDRPLLLSIAGSQTSADFIADVNMGTLQMKSGAFQSLVEKMAQETKDWKGDVMISGHSLGGGMAQILGHDLITQLRAENAADLIKKVKVVTFNGFGGTEPLRRAGRLNQESKNALQATNYYVKNDKIKNFGTHIGETVQLPKLGFNQLKAHGTDTLQEALVVKNGIRFAVNKVPYRSRLLTALSWLLGPMADRLQKSLYLRQEKALLTRYSEAVLMWADQEGFKNMNHSYQWLEPELAAIVTRMKDPKDKKRGEQFLRWIDSEKKRIIAQRQAPVNESAEINIPVVDFTPKAKNNEASIKASNNKFTN